MKDVTLSPPWITRAREIKALFDSDPDITVVYNDEGTDGNPSVTLLVDDSQKAEALDQILPDAYQFGNVTLVVFVKPSNNEMSKTALLQHAFAGNPAVVSIETLKVPVGDTERNYVLFEPRVVQFYNDDITDVYGLETTIYEDIARKVFDESMEDVSFCTQILMTATDTPSSEWP